ncbi:hypothetical protein IE81DRAFT_286652 [Ceraceosorus guamensis]|uniref:Large ribosomal subunit protein uL29m n=1 Tax=Ceraceosorus guamensis TaxID=1522189 RepID=A0A316W6L7_9BASI|nr:hypothetical protein IE81DRAFT_286652 [Ceraceosorus guamensis]PWN44758.1 hypothetical protein IE81DRAFT_286652 [Ceraceosorus guamensis]
MASCSISDCTASASNKHVSRAVNLASAFSTSCKASQAPIPTPVMPQAQAEARTQPPKDLFELTVRYPRHPLLGFFEKVTNTIYSSHPFHPSKGVNKGTKQPYGADLPASVRDSDFGAPYRWGRSWKVPELRTKSSVVLHQLWYTCLFECNKMATTNAEIRRVGLARNAEQAGCNIEKRKHSVRKTMARIKFVLNERRLALQQAIREAKEVETEDGVNVEEQPAEADKSVRLTRQQRIKKLKKLYKQGQNLEEAKLLEQVNANELLAQERGPDPTAFDGIAEAELRQKINAADA